MFEKDLEYPIPLLQHEAFKGRLPENHEILPEIDEKIRILASGYKGERTLNYYLSLIPDKKYHIFHGLRLPIGKSYFEIDALLISPYLNLILESKNHSGTLTIEKHQMIQELPDFTNIYSNPLSQAIRHKILLHYFFEKYQIPIIPIEYLVVFTKATSVVKITPGYIEAERKICKAEDLIKKITEFEKVYTKERLDQKMIGKMKRLLLSKHTPLRIDLLKTYRFNKCGILPGVRCPKCLFFPMKLRRKKWECSRCHFTSNDAYIPAVQDYFLIIDTSINNKELCWFLQLPSPRHATYLFSLMNLPHSSANKNRTYFIPFSSIHVFPK